MTVSPTFAPHHASNSIACRAATSRPHALCMCATCGAGTRQPSPHAQSAAYRITADT